MEVNPKVAMKRASLYTFMFAPFPQMMQGQTGFSYFMFMKELDVTADGYYGGVHVYVGWVWR